MEGIVLKKNKNVIDVKVTKIDETKIIFLKKIENLIKKIDSEDNFFVFDRQVLSSFETDFLPITSKHPYVLLKMSEKTKSWRTLKLLIDKAIASGISRKGAFVAIGGGVTTDITGLAANLYFRGIKVILVPTSLLAMVDASIGGKVAVNHPHQKNMIGSFYHPNSVIFCSEFLNSLPKRHMLSAAGEILKLGVLSKTRLFFLLEKATNDWYKDKKFLDTVIKLSVVEKMEMLGRNCFERDLKRPLNLGHSIAHPLEDITNFKVFHGEAVAYGVLIASNISKQRKILSEKDYLRIVRVAKKLGMQIPQNYNVEGLWARVRRLVKQRGGKGLLYVLPRGIGKNIIVNDIAKKELLLAIAETSEIMREM